MASTPGFCSPGIGAHKRAASKPSVPNAVPEEDNVIKMRFGSSIALDPVTGKYKCIIHKVTGIEHQTMEIQPEDILVEGEWMDTMDQAMACGSAFLDELIAKSDGTLVDIERTMH
jgi:hypothetical protein